MVRSLLLINVLTCGRAHWCMQQASSGALDEYLLTTLAHLSSALVSLCECLAVTIWSGYLPSSGLAGARATVLQEWLAEFIVVQEKATCQRAQLQSMGEGEESKSRKQQVRSNETSEKQIAKTRKQQEGRRGKQVVRQRARITQARRRHARIAQGNTQAETLARRPAHAARLLFTLNHHPPRIPERHPQSVGSHRPP